MPRPVADPAVERILHGLADVDGRIARMLVDAVAADAVRPPPDHCPSLPLLNCNHQRITVSRPKPANVLGYEINLHFMAPDIEQR
jgi:hypothetical protein